jgi:hypothetical protein
MSHSAKKSPVCRQHQDFVVCFAENVSPQGTPPSTAFTDFTPTLRMTGSARSSGVFLLDKANPYSQNVGSDPTVFQLTDFTNTTTRMLVTLGSRNATCFTIRPRSGGRFPLFINCPSTPLPSGLPIGVLRRDEIVAVILYGTFIPATFSRESRVCRQNFPRISNKSPR